MNNENFRFQFSKMLIESAINVMEEIDQTKIETDKLKLLGLYSSIAQSMEFVIEQYISEKDATNKELFLEELRDKLNKFQPNNLDSLDEDTSNIIRYRGKDYPKA